LFGKLAFLVQLAHSLGQNAVTLLELQMEKPRLQQVLMRAKTSSGSAEPGRETAW
jgi:hypothetical protein